MQNNVVYLSIGQILKRVRVRSLVRRLKLYLVELVELKVYLL